MAHLKKETENKRKRGWVGPFLKKAALIKQL